MEKQLRGRKATKLLVGAKLDQDSQQINQNEIEALMHECGCMGFLPTSAKAPRGIVELGEVISRQINWDDLARTTRLRTFQHVREIIESRRKSGEVVLLYSDLLKLARDAEPDEFDPAVVNAVTEQLAGQGEIADTRLSTGERALVLQIGYIEIYAGSLILLAMNNQRGVPAIELTEALFRKSYPEIRDEERLNPVQERIVIECVIELMIEHGIGLRHEGLLIFPTLFPSTVAEDESNIAHTVSLFYDFSGAIDNIYSSLVVRLALSEKFGRVRMSKNRAEYEMPDQGICGLRKVDRSGGWAHLDLVFTDKVPRKTQDLFTVFVEDHLNNEGIKITEVLEVVCVCGYRFEEPLIREYIAEGRTEIICPRPKCQRPNRISEGAAKARADNPEIEKQLVALKTRIAHKQERDVAESKKNFKPIEVFFSYSHKDEKLRDDLEKHLSILKRQSVIQAWHDRKITAGTEWKRDRSPS